MIIIEREIQIVRPDKWTELEEIDKKFNVVESRLGFPIKKRYRSLVGGHTTATLIIERQWESLAAAETAYERAIADPEHRELSVEVHTSIIDSAQVEFYMPLP